MHRYGIECSYQNAFIYNSDAHILDSVGLGWCCCPKCKIWKYWHIHHTLFYTNALHFQSHTHNSDASALDRRAARTGNTRNEKVYAQTPTGRHKSWLVGLLMPSPKFVLSKEFEYVLIDDAGKKMVENAAIDFHHWIWSILIQHFSPLEFGKTRNIFYAWL